MKSQSRLRIGMSVIFLLASAECLVAEEPKNGAGESAASKPANATSDDQTRTQLETAKDTHRRTLDQARTDFLKAMDERIKALSARGDLEVTKAAVVARDAFAKDGKLPEIGDFAIALGSYRRSVEGADVLLKRAYESAVRSYTKSLNLEAAEAARAELKALAGGSGIPQNPILSLTFEQAAQMTRGKELLLKVGGGANDLATTKGVTFAPGYIGPAARFSDKEAYIEIANEPRLNPDRVTTAAWVYVEKTGEATIIDKHEWDRGNLPKGYVMRLAKGKPEFAIGDGVAWHSITSAVVPPTRKWFHIAGTYDESELKLYINGEEVGKTQCKSTIRNSEWPLRIGNGSFDSARSRGIDGMIDEVYIFSRALTPAEVKALAKQAPSQ